MKRAMLQIKRETRLATPQVSHSKRKVLHFSLGGLTITTRSSTANLSGNGRFRLWLGFQTKMEAGLSSTGKNRGRWQSRFAVGKVAAYKIERSERPSDPCCPSRML